MVSLAHWLTQCGLPPHIAANFTSAHNAAYNAALCAYRAYCVSQSHPRSASTIAGASTKLSKKKRSGWAAAYERQFERQLIQKMSETDQVHTVLEQELHWARLLQLALVLRVRVRG